MNYRTGAFGFLSGPTFQEDGTANAGLYDQRMALEWIQTYIHLFGGDRNRVTVFGGSAGAGSLIHQVVAFGGSQRAPFQQAVPQSPGWPNSPTLFAQEETFNDFLAQAGVSSLAELRQMPSNNLIHANALQIARAPYSSFIYGPVIDGKFVTQDPRVLLDHDQYFKDLRVMVAHNTNEGLGFAPPSINNSDFYDLVKTGFPTAEPSVLNLLTDEFYPPPSNESSLYHDQISRAAFLATESNFACKAFSFGRAFNESYGYWFDVFPAVHGLDSSYVFFNPHEKGPSSPNETLAFAIQDYITTFAISGVPSSSVDGLAAFPKYGEQGNVIKLSATSISHAVDMVANDRCRWYDLGLYM
jgi:carboxylesterase type B